MRACPNCGRQIKEEAVYCRYCRRDAPLGVAASSGVVAAPLSPESPIFAGWLVGGGVTLIALIGATLLVGRVVGPAIAHAGTIQGIQGTLRKLAISFYLASFICAALGGAVGAWWAARRGARDRLHATLIGASAPLLVAAILTAWSMQRHLSNRPALIFGSGLFAIGAALGAVAAPKRGSHLRANKRGQPGTHTPGGSPGVVLGLALAIGLNPQTHVINRTGYPTASGVLLAGAASAPNPLDIAPSDCTVNAVIAEGEGSLAVFGLEIGPDLSFEASHLADDKWKASITIGGKVGLKIGEGAHIKLTRLVGGFAFSGAIDATLQKSADYEDLSEGDLLGLVSVDGLRSASRLDGVMAILSDLFRVGGSNQQATGLTDGSAHLPNPSRQGVTVGGEFDGKLFFGTTAAFSVELKGRGQVGITFDDEDLTVETVLRGSASGELDSLTGSVGGELDGDAKLSYTVSRKWPYRPKSISFEATGMLAAIRGEGGSNEVHPRRKGPRPIPFRNLNEIRGFLRKHLGLKSARALTGAGVSIKTGASIEVEAAVDFDKHPEDRAAFLGFASAILAASTQETSQKVRQTLESLGAELKSRVERDGTVQAFLYGTTKGEASVDLTVGAGFLTGVSLSGSLTAKDLLIAGFRDPSQGFLRSTQCIPVPATL